MWHGNQIPLTSAGGGVSQIVAELKLLSAAVKKGYDYYHLLSGVDFPLRNQKEIDAFFASQAGKNFIHFDARHIDEQYMERFSKYHFFGGRDSSVISKALEHCSLSFQRMLGVDRSKVDGFEYMKGANWFSIENGFAHYVVEKKDALLRRYEHTITCDEVFLQTLIWNSPYRESLYIAPGGGSYKSIMRAIDWQRGNPYVWRDGDFDELMTSGMLFARKFNYDIFPGIVDRLLLEVS